MASDWTELILFTRKSSDGTGNGAQWYVKYKTTKEDAGKTKVEWELYKRGRESSPRNLATTLNFYINGNKVCAIARDEFNSPNSDGSNHPHTRYTAAANTTPTKTGDFTVNHNTDGTGSFTMQLETAIYTQTLSFGELKTVNLENNLPQTPCYWASNATVIINKTYIAPGSTFKVSWSGATAGISNAISGYNVFYKVGSGDYIQVETTTSNTWIEATLPQNATRGSKITVKVSIVDTKNITDANKTNASSIVNPALNNLIINNYSGKNTNNVFSYKDETVSFNYTKPTKSTNQNITVKIRVDGLIKETSEQSYTYTIPSNWAYTSSKTFEFCATDGEEDTQWQNITITRNSDASRNGALTYENYVFTCTVPTNCTGTLGLTENKVITVKNGQRVDIRSLFNFNLISNTAYANLKGTLTCVCGIDEDSFEIGNRSFQVPNFKLSSLEDGLADYFDGTADTMQVLVKEEDSWVPLELPDWVFQGIDSKLVAPGDGLNCVIMKGQNGDNFTVQTKNSITVIKDLKLDFSIENNKYKPYSEQPLFKSQIEDNDWKKYGLTGAPTIGFWFGNGILCEGEYIEISNNDIISYRLKNKADYYYIAEEFNSDIKPPFSFSYQYTNIYGKVVTQTSTASIELDFKEKAQISNSTTKHYICAIPEGDWNTAYAIENWSYIKEGMSFSTDYEIASTIEPTAWLEREIGTETGNWQKFYDFQVKVTEEQNSDLFNIPVNIYVLLQNGELGQIVNGTSGRIRLIVKTDSLENLEEVYSNSREFEFAQHLPPLTKFTEVSYSAPSEENENGTILAKYQIPSLGSDNNFNLAKTYKFKIENEEELISQSSIDEEAQEVTFSYKISGTFIKLAPILVTTLSATITINEETKTGFETIYSTSEKDYEYIVCYNLLPTVAYRQNYLGINTNNPAINGNADLSNPVLTISAYNQYKMVHLVSSKNSASIDLETGAMLGFVVDCGSWSGIPGGIIPGGDTPAGLAAIAYTGQIRDLQEGDYEVILYSADEKI